MSLLAFLIETLFHAYLSVWRRLLAFARIHILSDVDEFVAAESLKLQFKATSLHNTHAIV